MPSEGDGIFYSDQKKRLQNDSETFFTNLNL